MHEMSQIYQQYTREGSKGYIFLFTTERVSACVSAVENFHLLVQSEHLCFKNTHLLFTSFGSISI